MRSRGDAAPSVERARDVARTAARALLVTLGVVLPFEVRLGRVGPVTVTTVEAVLYGTIGLWLAGRALEGLPALRARLRRAVRAPLDRAVGVWLGALVICAVAAPAHRVAAAKFTLRALGGGLLFFAARDLLEDRRAVARRLVLGLVFGATVSAAGAVAETLLPNSAALWHSFRTTTFMVTGLPRPSGPFEYPTIAAMYWEAVLALVVALPAVWSPRRGEVGGLGMRPALATAAIAIGVAAVLVAAILLSATRTALVVAALASAAMALWAFGRQADPTGGPGRARPRGDLGLRVVAGSTLVLVACLAGVTLASPAGTSPLAARLRWWQDGSWYVVRYALEDQHLTMDAASIQQVPVTIENAGGLAWPHLGEDPVHLSYHWESSDARGAHLEFEGRRTVLPSDLPPGETVRVLGTVQAPSEPGRYRLRWDLVREHVTWFSEHGNGTADQLVDVVRATAASRRAHPPSTIVDSTLEDWVASYAPTRPELWRAAFGLWKRHPVLGVGPDNYRRGYSEMLPSGAKPFGLDPIAAHDDRIHANSLYFETLADLGLVGMLALGWLMLAIGRLAWAAWRAPDGAAALAHAHASAGGVALAVAVGTFFVHGLLDWFFEFTPTYGLFWLLLALLATTTTTTTTRPAPDS